MWVDIYQQKISNASVASLLTESNKLWKKFFSPESPLFGILCIFETISRRLRKIAALTKHMGAKNRKIRIPGIVLTY